MKQNARHDKVVTALWSLGQDPTLLTDRALPVFPEARTLRHVGIGNDGRDKFLAPAAAEAWLAMRASAATDGVQLHLISAFRSIEYQLHIIQLKMASGRSLKEILQVNAPPGCSEHHTGRAVDIGYGDCPPLDDAFESTDAFQWLNRHADRYGFVMSYPRGNRQGYLYEPWHWCWHRGLSKRSRNN